MQVHVRRCLSIAIGIHSFGKEEARWLLGRGTSVDECADIADVLERRLHNMELGFSGPASGSDFSANSWRATVVVQRAMQL